MFKKKIYEIFKDLSNLFDIASTISNVGYDDNGTDHDKTVCRVLQIWRKNLKFNKGKCYFRCTNLPFFGEITYRYWVKHDPPKPCTHTENPLPKLKKESQLVMGIMTT